MIRVDRGRGDQERRVHLVPTATLGPKAGTQEGHPGGWKSLLEVSIGVYFPGESILCDEVRR